jgi:cystathionine beta-lyase/cystathionine gamma-synthase
MPNTTSELATAVLSNSNGIFHCPVHRIYCFCNLPAIGAVPSPFDCYLVNRGLKTLALRMEAHMKSGLTVARWLESNPRVSKVVHPGMRTFICYCAHI